MATTAMSAGTFTSFANVSQTSAPGTCGPCTSVQIYDLWRGSWTQNASLPAIRTIQPILDPAHNTTTTSVICNTAALSAYDQCDRMTLNDNCDIVCEDRNGRQEFEDPYTITLTSSSGNFVQFANTFRIQGGVSTTDSNGAFTCLNTSATLDQTSYTYAGPTSVTETGMRLLIMSELTDAYPGVALFEQCTWFQTGPPPRALTPANQIVLPVMTMPGAGTTSTQLPTTSPTTPTTTARPADSGTDTTPTRTSQPQTTSTNAPTVPEEPENEPTTIPPPEGSEAPPSETAPAEEPAEEPVTSATQGVPSPPVQSDNNGGQNGGSDAPPTIVVPTQADNDSPNTVAPPESPATNAGSQAGNNVPIVPATTATPVGTTAPIAIVPGVTFQEDNGSAGVIVGGSATIGAGDAAAVASGTTFSVLPSAGGVVAVADGSTTTLPLPAVTANAGQEFVQPITSSAQGFVIPGATISGGGGVVAVSGTTFSALPSNLGVVAISESGSTTVQASQVATLGISTVSGTPGAYVLPAQTLSTDGSAIVNAGTTYSALPQGSGIQVAASGSTNVIPIAGATSIPGIGEVSVADAPEGYILAGSVTVQPGGPAATISGVVYSALPSGLGVLVANSSDDIASYIEQGISGSDSDSSGNSPYIIGSDTSLTAGGDAVTVSGTTYSALPSGSGVLVVADGESTTIELASTANERQGDTPATATSGTDSDGTEETVVPYASAASPMPGPAIRRNAFMILGLIAAAIMF